MHTPFTDRIAKWLSRTVRENGVVDASGTSAVLATTVGHVRENNEDRVAVARYTPRANTADAAILYVVCDGIGGMRDGARCAELAIASAVCHFFMDRGTDTARRLANAVHAANEIIFRQYAEKGGTTLSALFAGPNGNLWIVHVGDGRIYAINKDFSLIQLTRDDTVEEQLRKMGALNTADANAVPYAKGILQYVGMGEELRPQVVQLLKKEQHAEGLLITTDGLYRTLGDTISRALSGAPTHYEAARRLIQMSKWCAAKDNVSFILFHSEQEITWPDGSDDDLLEIWDGHSKFELPLPSGRPEFDLSRTKITPPVATQPPSTPSPTRKEKALAFTEDKGRRRRADTKPNRRKSKKPARGRKGRDPRQLDIEIYSADKGNKDS